MYDSSSNCCEPPCYRLHVTDRICCQNPEPASEHRARHSWHCSVRRATSAERPWAKCSIIHHFLWSPESLWYCCCARLALLYILPRLPFSHNDYQNIAVMQKSTAMMLRASLGWGDWKRETWHREACCNVRVPAQWKFCFATSDIVWTVSVSL